MISQNKLESINNVLLFTEKSCTGPNVYKRIGKMIMKTNMGWEATVELYTPEW